MDTPAPDCQEDSLGGDVSTLGTSRLKIRAFREQLFGTGGGNLCSLEVSASDAM